MDALSAVFNNPTFHAVMIGFVTGFALDMDIYSRSADDAKFNWKKAIARWVAGGLIGAGFSGH